MMTHKAHGTEGKGKLLSGVHTSVLSHAQIRTKNSASNSLHSVEVTPKWKDGHL